MASDSATHVPSQQSVKDTVVAIKLQQKIIQTKLQKVHLIYILQTKE